MSEPTGFNITTRVDGKTTTFRQPIADPFLLHTVTVETWPVSWLPRLLKKRHVVEVIVDADKDTMRGVFHVLETPPAQRGMRGTRTGGSESTK